MSTALVPIVIIAVVVVTQSFLANRYDWQCANCGHVFSLSPVAAALLPHRPVMRKLARCPSCGVLSWASPVAKQ